MRPHLRQILDTGSRTMIYRWFFERAARLLNRQIATSISASRQAAELNGHTCRIRVEGLPVNFILRIHNSRLTIDSGSKGEADVSITGTPFDLLHLTGSDAQRRIHDTNVRLEGQIHVADKFANLLRLCQPDLEDELAGWIGDVAAHAFGNAVRRSGAWMTAAGVALRDDTAEYLKEEGRHLPTTHEAEAFYADVERLRDDVERAGARLARLLAPRGTR